MFTSGLHYPDPRHEQDQISVFEYTSRDGHRNRHGSVLKRPAAGKVFTEAGPISQCQEVRS